VNAFARPDYLESVRRLALGVEAVDAARGRPSVMPVTVSFDDLSLGNKRPLIRQLPSNRCVLLYDDYYAGKDRTCDIRIFDSRSSLYAVESDGRRYVPRRFRIALPKLATAETASPLSRLCRPFLYPGPAYPVSNTATGLRAIVIRGAGGGKPIRAARWVRVLASIPATQADLKVATVIGRAFGDDRGEFLLLVPYHPDALGENSLLKVRLWIFAGAETDPPTKDRPTVDPLWDIPLEQPASLADSDAVLRGEKLPPGYAKVAEKVVSLPLGRMLRGQPNFVI
jgi:hypothetical protein